jgi:hypothetical protein
MAEAEQAIALDPLHRWMRTRDPEWAARTQFAVDTRIVGGDDMPSWELSRHGPITN